MNFETMDTSSGMSSLENQIQLKTPGYFISFNSDIELG